MPSPEMGVWKGNSPLLQSGLVRLAFLTQLEKQEYF
jgi:hypothetical protein